MNPLQIAENLSAAGLDHPAVDDAVIKLTNMAKAEPVAWMFEQEEYGEWVTRLSLSREAGEGEGKRNLRPLTHPSRGVVDEVRVKEIIAKYVGRTSRIYLYIANDLARAQHEANKAAALPAVPDGMVLVPRGELNALLSVVKESTYGSDLGREGRAKVALQNYNDAVAATPAHDQPEGGR